jgi:hypothetical protein
MEMDVDALGDVLGGDVHVDARNGDEIGGGALPAAAGAAGAAGGPSGGAQKSGQKAAGSAQEKAPGSTAPLSLLTRVSKVVSRLCRSGSPR